ncbi:MAG: glycosyltransferase [Candidatus Saccharibacteria bacterium]|nr:glycosyltransferase [Candidatus Saccharibacteria bacterium]
MSTKQSTNTNINTHPKVSIVIPVYNGSNFMRDAIDSALAQTYDNYEIIVVNDGSTDGGKTDAIAKSYGDSIRYFHKKNGGVSTAINYGVEHMTGEYFSWLSHDDMYMPNKIEAEIDYLKEHNLLGKKVIAYSDYRVVDKHGKYISDLVINHELADKHQTYAFMRGAINGNSMLIPKSAWREYGGLDTKLICTQDYEKWFEMNKTYKFVHVPKVLIKSRYHAGQVTNTNPKVRTEGNDFWIKVVKSNNASERKKLNGSDYAYYYYFIEYFKNTPYDEALAYCQNEIKKYAAPKEPLPKENLISYLGSDDIFSKNPIIKLYQLINREGIKNTTKRIGKKLKSIGK